jgi:hypothetical protein
MGQEAFELSNEEKLRILQDAREKLILEQKLYCISTFDGRHGLCWAIGYSMNWNELVQFTDMLEYFPELRKYQPSLVEIAKNSGYWWPLSSENLFRRLNILNYEIYVLKEKIIKDGKG